VAARVSVVIPVYNTVSYLPEALGSLAAQDLPTDAFEVIAVDDGSTDGSGALLDRWAQQAPHRRVVHQANSGWPGQPRNRGVDASTAEYVMFMDSDDYLGPETLRRLVSFADTHGSDVVVPKVVPVQGRRGRRWEPGVWVDVDLRRALISLMPQKLIRRSLLLEHGLRFPEGEVRLEDGIFMASVYLRARRVSLVADYDYYYLRKRAEGDNISSQQLQPEGYTDSIRQIGLIVRELCPDPALADDIVRDLYRRKALKVFNADRFLAYGPTLQLAWTQAVGALADVLVPVALEQQLDEPLRTRSALGRARDVEGQRAYASAHSDDGPPMSEALVASLLAGAPRGPGPLPGARLQVELTGLQTVPTALVLGGRLRLRGTPPERLDVALLLAHRQHEGARRELPVRTGGLDADGWQDWQAEVTPDQVVQLRRGLWDVLLRTPYGDLEQRVLLPDTGLPLPPPLPVPARDGALTVNEPSPGVRRLSLRVSGTRPWPLAHRPSRGRQGS